MSPHGSITEISESKALFYQNIFFPKKEENVSFPSFLVSLVHFI
jgi:hypothetical protein